jgi:hypothetical protein
LLVGAGGTAAAIDQRSEDVLTQPLIHAAEPVDLLRIQSQSRHFQELFATRVESDLTVRLGN